MTHKDKMPAVTQLLEMLESAAEAHIVAAALPRIIVSMTRAWEKASLNGLGAEERIEFVMNEVATDVLVFIASQSST